MIYRIFLAVLGAIVLAFLVLSWHVPNESSKPVPEPVYFGSGAPTVEQSAESEEDCE